MSKWNHMICPNCGHECYTNGRYVECYACMKVFFALDSRTCNPKPPTVPKEGKCRRWPFHLSKSVLYE